MANYLYTNDNGDLVVATSKAQAEEIVGGKVSRAKGPRPRCSCGKPVEVFRSGTLSWQCEGCEAAEHAAECASLTYAEDGGGSEYANDLACGYDD
jgi:ribosomal protein L37AE/L43A